MRQFAPERERFEVARDIAEMVYPSIFGIEHEVRDSDTNNLIETIEPYKNFYESRLGKVVAFGSIGTDLIDSGIGRLELLCVDPEVRGQGIGRAFVEDLEEEIRQLGGDTIVVDSLPTAASFYKELGYEPIGYEPLKFGKSL